MNSKPQVAVLGLGAWGSTLALLIKRSGYEVRGWSRSCQVSLTETIAPAQVIVSALPMRSLSEIAQRVADFELSAETILVSASKGLEPDSKQGRPRTPSQIWQTCLPHNPVVILSGPNLSEEICQGLPAASVVASRDEEAAEQVRNLFAAPKFRVYTNPDPVGVELGGVLKNIMAIACGVNDGLSLGTNARSALITRGLVEIVRVGVHWGGQPETFYGLSGLGDLLATCTSSLSRNYQVGWALAQGKPLATVLSTLVGTAEGVNAAPVLAAYAQSRDLEVPITEAVCSVLSGQCAPEAAIADLINRPPKAERL
ncbi:NAD(P)H-dependent glycerol-3-phosphate dehydrogenase [Leptolyngbya sp. FACHB-261]|uniref:NAD(P)H-dependent glycerol-3-phosphate dehydrogenase n=1 Tax=Leptolyngbya sp. FACHB-261 TaxID=2692806 RepID=UPI001683E85B|nr:NAD(P)H-dependent glycerol-3-phosphate dehydrogenase [Leptolyngbya sp. FACHB-261]MBD2100520.1 NAD(P)H-dependent glycerol-3-phosphate dehydrogenase [Leptolyngbya sp. FACHB-261]